MACQDLIEDFKEHLTSLETKINSIANELTDFREDRKRIESLSESCQNTVSSTNEFVTVINELQRLKTENDNLTYDLEEWKSAYDEKANECELNRNKYLKAQHEAEVYRRQFESIGGSGTNDESLDAVGLQVVNERINEQICELSHLTFTLEAKQLELEDTLKKLKVAEKTIEALSYDLESCIVKCELQHEELEQASEKNKKFHEEESAVLNEVAEWKNKFHEVVKQNEVLAQNVQLVKELQFNLEAKTNEVHEVEHDLEELREENSRHISRIKDRADVQKRTFQTQINGLERELIKLRARLSSAHRERDEVKQRMHDEMIKLRQHFDDSQLEIHSLKSHVDILKSSYSTILDSLNEDVEEEIEN